ncbi:MAG: hypothetical protein U1C46_10275 [Bacteroidales bacterium]|nr:hypothetical protein [Bacteroidales bacterium]
MIDYKKVACFAGILFFTFIRIQFAYSQPWDSEEIESSFFRSIRANQKDGYVTFSQGIGNMEPLIFEGLLAPYYLLRTSKDARWGATISPAILLRMRADLSFPVRTPSYMPNITFYHSLKELSDKRENSAYLFLMLSHHSNGQDGSFYNEDGSVNTRNGDFSTDFLEFGIFLSQKFIPFAGTNEFFRTSLEIHTNLSRSKELEGRYSFVRWHNSFRIFRFPFMNSNTASGYKQADYKKIPRVQTKIETTWLFGNIDGATFFNAEERFNFSVTMSVRPKFLSDVSLFANFYTGEDYYNMFFYRRITVLRFGIQAYSFK